MDRPIIIDGGNQMITITIPSAAKQVGVGQFTLKPTSKAKPFKRILVKDGDPKVKDCDRPATGHWTITVE